ncbi:hypothetical protein ACWGJ2_25455 [Streptomyces sp. NPDC054796]
MTVTPEIPAATSGDWWVTAGRSLDHVQDRDAGARTAPDLLGTLSELGELRRAADTALGAAVRALLAAGRDWAEIASALGYGSEEEARLATALAMDEARLALDRRIGHH